MSRHRATREENDAALGGLILVLCLVGLVVCVVVLALLGLAVLVF